MTVNDDDIMSSNTPYRLPKLWPSSIPQSPHPDVDQTPTYINSPPEDKVWSRYGYENIIRIPEMGTNIQMLLPKPKSNPNGLNTDPAVRSKHVAITPTIRSMPLIKSRELSDYHLQLYQCNVNQVREDEIAWRSARLDPTTTPISRSNSPAKSIKSIHWILGYNRYPTFDMTGRGRIQGPYSREFTVTCTAPQNWLKMKWGRSKTIIN